VAAAGERVLGALDDALAALAAGYAQARRGVVREQVSARREFVDDLLAGAGDVAGLLARAPGFGLDLAARTRSRSSAPRRRSPTPRRCWA
jgi:hypothetical protein